MAQTTVLAAGNAAGPSSTIVVASGAKVTVGLFVAAGDIPASCQFNVVQKTPGADLPYPVTITSKNPRFVLDAPGSYVVNRVTGGSTMAVGTLGLGKFFYKVTAVNAQGESLGSNEVSVTTSETSNAITASWSAVTGATSYKLYRGTAAGGENVMFTLGNVLTMVDTGTGGAAGTVPTTDTSKLATPVQSNTSTATTGGTLAAGTYYYKVTAINALGETVGSNEKSQATTGAASTVTVTWAAVPNATGYKIYRGTAAGAENKQFTVGAVTTFTDTGAAGTAASPPTTDSTHMVPPVQSALAVASPGVATAASVGVFTET